MATNEQTSRVVSVRLPLAAAERLEQAAKAELLTKSAVARRIVCQELGLIPRPGQRRTEGGQHIPRT